MRSIMLFSCFYHTQCSTSGNFDNVCALNVYSLYMILHVLAFNIYFYETSVWKAIIKRASFKLYHVSRLSSTKCYVKMTTSIIPFMFIVCLLGTHSKNLETPTYIWIRSQMFHIFIFCYCFLVEWRVKTRITENVTTWSTYRFRGWDDGLHKEEDSRGTT